ncbi:sensor histidine kinase [Nonomuraea sp. NBC_01738]|uniref:sensor histidine kinase n=1 Tax=Nonomuraea sp. NBC_01738 TaxID=2976003 RepID=UPI002E0D3E51|nr:sensor histidine kinase [Nonomuraea sp. NBC_01738]
MRKPSGSTLVSLAAVGGTWAGVVVTWLLRDELSPNWLDLVLPLVAGGVTFLRDRFPVGVLIVVALCCGVYYPWARLDGPLLLLFMVALFTAADRGRLLAAIAIGAVSLLGMGIGETGSVRHVDDSQFMMITGWVVAALAFGGVTRNRRAYQHEAEQRALDAERTKEEEARLRATEERLRIARELHDVLGHNISLINVQAGAALHGLKKRPEDAESALRTIKDTSKDTLRQLRTTLGVLRQVDEDAPTAPADSLSRLDDLVKRSGIEVEVRGSAPELAAPVDLAAARIIQESLTNVSRHSAAGAATLELVQRDGSIVITVSDQGPGTAFTGGSGFGVQGMRERATALGGTLEAGPKKGGGFTVVATLPMQAVQNGQS